MGTVALYKSLLQCFALSQVWQVLLGIGTAKSLILVGL
jgi:hypothetical protein